MGLAFVLGHGLLDGGVYFERDIHLVWYAWIEAFVRCLAAGSWPLWDPWTGFGMPMLANPSTQVLYPPTWLNLIMQPWTYYRLYVIGHLAFAGLGLYILCRRLHLTRSASVGAAAVWMGSGPLISLVNVTHHFAGATWVPWVLLAAKEAIEAARPRTAGLLGAVLAGQVLAGSADMCAISTLLVGAFAAAQIDRKNFLGSQNRAYLLRIALFGLVAAGLSAGQWLPTVASAVGSARFALSLEKRTFWSVHPLALVQFIIPVSFEELPRTAAWATPLFDLWAPFLRSVYLGLPAAILVLATACNRRPYRNLFALVGLAALLFSLGRHTPFHAVVSALLPPLQIFRYPSKATILVGLCFAMLSGMGIEAVRDSGVVRRLLLVAPAVGAALALGLLARIVPIDWLATGWVPLLTGATTILASLLALGSQARRGEAIAALAVLDLVGAHWFVNPTTRKEFFIYRPEILKVFPRGQATRLYVWDYVMPVVGTKRTPNRLPIFYENPPGWLPKVGSAMAMQSYLYPPSAARFDLYGSYDPDLLDLGGRTLYDMNTLVRGAGGTPAYARLMGIGSVDYVVALHDEGFHDLERVATIPGLYSEPIRVFRVPATLPKAYVVGASRVAAEPESYRALLDESFDPSREIVLPEGDRRGASPEFKGAAKIIDLRPDRVRIEAEANRDGYVVMVAAHAPGWQATVDGEQAPLLRANVLFRAVAIPPGRHVVEFRYRPGAVLIGLGVSVMTLAAWAWLLWRVDR